MSYMASPVLQLSREATYMTSPELKMPKFTMAPSPVSPEPYVSKQVGAPVVSSVSL
jgi:hypothetical protein